MSTILKVVATGVALWAMVLLAPQFLLFLVAVLFAVTLHPAVCWLERRRIPRGVAVAAIAAAGLGTVALFVIFVVPPLTTEMRRLVDGMSGYEARLSALIPPQYPAVHKLIAELFLSPSAFFGFSMAQSFVWGQSFVSGVVVGGVVLVLTLYLLLDGKSLYAWLLAFVPRAHREKLATTMDEVSDVVHAYVGGQLLAALLFAVFTAILLTALGVPAVAPLAVIAGICDVIPVLGILLAVVPAVLLAVTVSPTTALVVALCYLGYHLFETYFLLPRIYGNKLKLSTLSVLLALIVGGSLQGILGAVLVLPLVAAYPIIERHWLGKYLRARVLTDHDALAKAAETGSDQAIDAVLLGEKHASEGGVLDEEPARARPTTV